MRILNVTQSYAPFFEFGGPPVKVRALAEGLAKKGEDVTVLTADWGLRSRLHDSPGEPPAQPNPFGFRRSVNGVTAIYLPTWLHYRAASWNPALPRYLRARLKDFSVVHIFGLYDLLGARVAAACRAHRIPYVVEPIGMFVPMVRNVWLKRVYHRMAGNAMLAGASAIIATAEQEQVELEAGGIARKKIILRRNGVEVPATLPERGGFRRSQNIPDAAKLILFLGRLSQKKSPDLLLGAFADVVGKFGQLQEPAYLVFVGPDEGGMKSRLERQAAQLGLGAQVRVCAPVSGESKWAVYRDADIFVLPSQNENFGNTAAEAVVAGTPVVVTDQCGIAPLLGDVAGVVVRHDREELAAALKNLLENPALYEKLRAGCPAAVERLGWKEPIESMYELYHQLAGIPRE